MKSSEEDCRKVSKLSWSGSWLTGNNARGREKRRLMAAIVVSADICLVSHGLI